jgi:hypothetical protein
VICMLDTDTDADDSHSATCIMLFMWGAMNLHCRAANLRTGVSYVLYGLPETARAWRDHGATVQGAHGSRPVMIEERVGAQYQNWYERSRVIPSATS